MPCLNRCIICNEYINWRAYFCKLCYAQLPLLNCHTKNAQSATLYVQQVLSAMQYRAPIKQLIQAFKFNAKFNYGYACSTLLLDYIKSKNNFNSIQALIPVPLHKTSLHKRRFNQSYIIAKFLSKQLKIPLQDCIIKHKNTRAQHTLSRNARFKNLHNSFALQASIAKEHVVIIDDVFTTGATINSIAALLYATGVKRIDAWTLARTL